MCLILFALHDHPEYSLVLAANRDEFFQRSTLQADYWKEDNSILGGMDIQSGGTWLGLQKDGRFMAITNYRDGIRTKENVKSRGILSKSFLSQKGTVEEFISELKNVRKDFDGFNIILSDDGFDSLYHYSNISNKCTKIPFGIHGLSNHLLNTPWPKVESGKKLLKRALLNNPINPEDVIKFMHNENKAPQQMLPNTGISRDLENQLSPLFISMKEYGTRCTTILMVTPDKNVSFVEITYNEQKQAVSSQEFNLKLSVPEKA